MVGFRLVGRELDLPRTPGCHCRVKDEAQLFRIEHFDGTAEDYRLRRARTDFCIGIGDTASGAEASRQPGSDAAAQRFRFELGV
ncbi:RICIN domain-containing protein [Amycolatopsis sp. lyj-109]|uniref:RICIN domain-containing protein n=1 Tax=Amycolatopsis sp. lyj-109 TaxID=2789287 RepID=UPI00397E246F